MNHIVVKNEMPAQRKTNNAEQEKKDNIDWIVTPGLKPVVEEFIELYECLYSSSSDKNFNKKPLMICGDTGVGKSLFINIFKKLYKKENEDKPIVRFNFASLSKDLIASELFGHIKGAFTGAFRDKKGLIEKANHGLLILEEIGEFLYEDQARLLTFIEDGYYYKVGLENEQYADVQIIATTNKLKDKFRDDFWSRFFQFYVPALFERRIDVLYYFYRFHKDILMTLTEGEILASLAYHWPGNVREIDNIGFLLKWKDSYRKEKEKKEKEDILWIPVSILNILKKDGIIKYPRKKYISDINELSAIFDLSQFKDDITASQIKSILNSYGIEISDTKLNRLMENGKIKCLKRKNSKKLKVLFRPYFIGDGYSAAGILYTDSKYLSLNFNIYSRLRKLENDINIDDLESFLKSIGFDPSSRENAIPEKTEVKIVDNENYKELEIKVYNKCNVFDRYDLKLFQFCRMFLYSPNADDNKDLLDIKKDEAPSLSSARLGGLNTRKFIRIYQESTESKPLISYHGGTENELQKQIYEFRTGKKSKESPNTTSENKHKPNQLTITNSKIKLEIDISTLTKDEIDKIIYKISNAVFKKKLEEAGGNIAKAANLLGFNENTLKGQLKKHPDLIELIKKLKSKTKQ